MSNNQAITVSFKSMEWTEKPVQAFQDLKHNHASANITFGGKDMKGKGLSSYVLTYNADGEGSKNSFTYDGQIIFEGTISGKSGAIVIRERGAAKNGVINANWVFAPETGSSELQDLAGEGEYTMKLGGGNAAPETQANLVLSWP